VRSVELFYELKLWWLFECVLCETEPKIQFWLTPIISRYSEVAVALIKIEFALAFTELFTAIFGEKKKW
jgi:hypothetical protein